MSWGWNGGGWGKGGGKGQGKDSFKVLPQNVQSTVWIGGIPEGLTFDEIKTNFGAAGTVKKVQFTGKGTGFAWFGSPEEAANAIAMFNGSNVNGSTLQVDAWTGSGKGSKGGDGGWSSGGKGGGGGWGGGKSWGKGSWGKGGGWGASEGAWQPQFGGKGKGGGGKGFKVLKENIPCTVWIGGLPEGLTHEEIKSNFEAAGTVKKVQLTGKGTGFAWFGTPQEATQAIAMFNGSNVNGSTLQVDAWTKKEF
mmetsp:Transcript_11507/g.26047  ORF Transcript_11507/g.26047 Transcript_11507/m.26047 type:complete len:250 (-) Transcript_11507:152-901(-)